MDLSPAAPRLAAIYAELANQFRERFPTHLAGPRTVGREAEYPLVTQAGEAGDVRRLWPLLAAPGDLKPQFDSGNGELMVGLKGADYSYAMEVGLGTIEVNTRPCADLWELCRIHEAAVGRLVQAATLLDYRLLAYGIQPLTPPAAALLAPKPRYLALHQAMGDPWLWYTVTASDQIQIDICQPELVDLLNYGNLITPILVALCANSPVHSGRLSPYCSAREGGMAGIYAQEYRHGMPRQPYTDLVDFVATLSQSLFLVNRTDGRYWVDNRPFWHHLRSRGADFEAFLLHEHYIWNSARARAAYATLELRPACQQPWAEHMVTAALCLGLLEARPAVEAYLTQLLGDQSWPVLRGYQQRVLIRGLAASPPAPDLLVQLLERAAVGLQARGRGEESFLQPLFARLERGQNPGQAAQHCFLSGGLSGLLEAVGIRRPEW